MLVGILRCQLTIICLYLRFLVPMVLTMKITVFWVMTPRSHKIYQTLWHHAPDSSNVRVYILFKSLFLGQNVTGFTCHCQRTTAN